MITVEDIQNMTMAEVIDILDDSEFDCIDRYIYFACINRLRELT